MRGWKKAERERVGWGSKIERGVVGRERGGEGGGGLGRMEGGGGGRKRKGRREGGMRAGW
jgi:hypothetical protein